jgi:hypothetical protein
MFATALRRGKLKSKKSKRKAETMDRDSDEYQDWLERATDVVAFVSALIGGALIDDDHRVAGWILLFVSIAMLFQRIRNLKQ